jgi:hypothetical protein
VIVALIGTHVARGLAIPVVLALVAPKLDVDAVAFALAFRAGKADAFKGKQISGAGMSFHGPVTERLADGSTRISLVITLGAADALGKLAPLATWDDFVAAERARTTLVVAISGPNLPPPPTSGPTLYEFSGVYDGQVRTIARAPQAVDVPGAIDAGPCPREEPRAAAQNGSFYCAPLLTGATATIRR